MRRLAAIPLLAISLADSAVAHLLDEYLQATLPSPESGRSKDHEQFKKTFS
jgi:hypothetical protein